MGFGSFDNLCAQSPLPLCSLLGPPTTLTSTHQPLILPICSARSIELANTIIFQAATDFAHIGALAMTAIMIFHVRSKFTAVGRKEILTFFYIFMGLTVVSLVLDAGVMEAVQSGPFPWFVAVQCGLVSALCTSLLINAFVGFQLYEDGTTLSVWLLRLTCLGMFIITFAVSLLTFKGWAGLGPENTTGLFVVLYVISAIFLTVYLVMQIILVVNTLQDRWPLGDIAFGILFFVVGQVIVYQFGAQICEGTSHYLDGLFFATVCNLLGVMMVYKYWDSITKEDLEFSVGTKQGNWEVKEPFIPEDDHNMTRASFYDGGHANRSSTYDLNQPMNRSSTYDNLSLDYRPQSQHQYTTNNNNNNSREKLATSTIEPSRNSYVIGGTQPETKPNYGDVRKSVNVQMNAMADYGDSASERDYQQYNAQIETRERRRRSKQSRRDSSSHGNGNGNGRSRERGGNRDRERERDLVHDRY